MDRLRDKEERGWPRSAAILGAGTMGLGVAECLVNSGIEVRLCDASPALAERGKDRLIDRARGHADTGLVSEGLPARVETSVTAADLSGAVRGAGFVFEAVAENLEVKQGILAEASSGAGEEVIIASNTSSLPINELSGSVERPERFLGMHWFNPPEWTPGVEVIPAADTSERSVEDARELLLSLGKRPAVVGDGPGFVANRIQMALFQEALRCVEEGLGSPEEVDEVVRSCFGFRYPFYGPFQIADMAGLDVYESVFETLERGLGERFSVPEGLRKLVVEGRVGTKGGHGFFEYTDEERDAMLVERDRSYAALNSLLSERITSRGGGAP